jgi:hypothetical protein
MDRLLQTRQRRTDTTHEDDNDEHENGKEQRHQTSARGKHTHICTLCLLRLASNVENRLNKSLLKAIVKSGAGSKRIRRCSSRF